MITLTDADSALKEYYLEAVTKELNEKISPFYSAIEKTSEQVYGKDVNVAVIKGGSGSVKAAAETASLPDPRSNRYLSITAPLKNIYGTIQLTDKAIRASRDDSGAFVNLLNAEMKGLVADAKNNFSRMLFGDGNGFLCNITGRAGDYVYNVDAAHKYYEGMKVDIRSAANASTVIESEINVVSVDISAGTVEFDYDIFDAGESSYSGKVYVSDAYGKELTGLGAIFNGDSVYGINKADESYVSPAVYNLSGSLTESALIDAIDKMEEQYDSKPDMIIVSYATRKAIGNLISDNRRIVNSSDLAVGYGEITVAGVPVYADRYCPENTVYILNTSDFGLYQLCDWEWLEDESGKILQQIAGKAAYSATLVKYAELICTRPCAQCMITFE